MKKAEPFNFTPSATHLPCECKNILATPTVFLLSKIGGTYSRAPSDMTQESLYSCAGPGTFPELGIQQGKDRPFSTQQKTRTVEVLRGSVQSMLFEETELSSDYSYLPLIEVPWQLDFPSCLFMEKSAMSLRCNFIILL